MRKLFTLFAIWAICQPGYSQVNTFPWFEDFETEIQCPTGCGPTCNLVGKWRNPGQVGLPASPLQWTSDRGGTGSGGTGPDVDHTLGTATGTYLYTETSCNGTGYPNITATIVSDWLDFRALTAPQITFWYHMLGGSMGTMHFDVDTSRQGNWVNDIVPSWTDNQNLWQERNISLAAFAGLDSVRLRIRGISGSSFTSDMAVDDIEVFEPQPYDFNTMAFSPSGNSCGVGEDTICVSLISAGTQPVFPGDTINASYSVDSMPAVSQAFIVGDTIFPGDTTEFCFSQPYNFANVSGYNIMVWSSYAQDSSFGNDTIMGGVNIVPYVTSFPYDEDFEGGQNGWNIDNNTNGTWAFGTPNKSVIQGAASGDNAFVSGGLTGNYNSGDNSWVQSPCFDLAGYCNPIVEMDAWWNLEFSWDGVNIQASTDGGASWTLIGALNDPINWYTDNTIAGNPGGSQIGWSGRASSGNGSGGYVAAKHDLSAVAGQSEVIFRVYQGTDGSVTDNGFAFDNVKVYDGVYLGRDVLVCAPDSANLDALLLPGDSVVWSTGDITGAINVNVSGDYIATITNSGCTNSDTITVVVIDSNTVANLGPDTLACGASYPLNPGYFPGANFTWSNGDSTPEINVSTSGMYSVMIETPCDTLMDSVMVTLSPLPVVNVGPDTAACGAYLIPSGSTGLSYAWSTGDTSSSLLVSSSGMYSLVATDNNGCSNMDMTNVTIWALPVVSVGQDTSYCENDSVCITANGSPLWAYLWSNGATSATTCFSAVGSYGVIATDTNGCIGADTLAITEEPLPVAGFNFTLGTGAGLSYDFSDQSSGTPTGWAWDFGDGSGTSTSQNPSYTYTANGSYTVSLTVSNDCGSSTDTVSITVVGVEDGLSAQVDVYPNPNQGSFNLSFESTVSKDAKVEVLDLYGRTVYVQELENINGTVNQRIDLGDQAAGTYFLRVISGDQVMTRRIIVE